MPAFQNVQQNYRILSNFITYSLCVVGLQHENKTTSINKLLAIRHKVSGKFKHITVFHLKLEARYSCLKIVNIMQPLIALVLHRRVDVV